MKYLEKVKILKYKSNKMQFKTKMLLLKLLRIK